MNTNTERLRELLEKATPGPWEHEENIGPFIYGGTDAAIVRVADCNAADDDREHLTEATETANAELLALSPTLAEELIEAREALRDIIELASNEADSLGDHSELEEEADDAQALVAKARALLTKHK